MAVVKGIKERVHLPLYDSLFVRPRTQLRDAESSSVLKFFVNVQGKTRLETNMQSTALLPHWNTFEARALRVVVSDLPARFSREVEQCLTTPVATSNGHGSATLAGCIKDLVSLIDEAERTVTDQQLKAARASVKSFNQAIENTDTINADWPGSIGILRIYGNAAKVTPILDLQSKLRELRKPLIDVLTVAKISELAPFLAKVKQLTDDKEEENLRNQLKDVKLITDAVEQLVALVKSIDKKQFDALQAFFTEIEKFLHDAQARTERLSKLKECLHSVSDEINKQTGAPTPASIGRCFNEKFNDKRLIPPDDQLFGRSPRILSRLIYNSVISFIVGEKTMIQMPTWFFPAGAGPFSEDGGSVTHGLPAPEATFRFAEPVFIDTQQNFRVEMEIPDAESLGELQRVYGPFFIWVTLDGYMTRDVQ